jgi:hypothetical protein
MLVAHLTPAIPGCTTWTTTTPDGGRNYEVVIIGCIVRMTARFWYTTDYPQIRTTSTGRKFLRTLHPDVSWLPHRVTASRQVGRPNPFVDPQGYFAWTINTSGVKQALKTSRRRGSELSPAGKRRTC